MSSRRRGFLLLSLAVASGGLAASRVRDLERDVEARVGAAVPVVVAARDVQPGCNISVPPWSTIFQATTEFFVAASSHA